MLRVRSSGVFIKEKIEKNGFNFSFRIRLHIDDVDVLHYICRKLGVGKVYLDISKAECTYMVSSLAEIISTIIPIFKFTKLYTTKYVDFFLLYSLYRGGGERFL